MIAAVPDSEPPPGQPPVAGPAEAEPPASGSAAPAADDRPVLPLRSLDDPLRSLDDSDTGWGDRPEPDDDERLREDRPPHWDAR